MPRIVDDDDDDDVVPAPVPDAKPIGISLAPVVFTAVFDHVAPPSSERAKRRGP